MLFPPMYIILSFLLWSLSVSFSVTETLEFNQVLFSSMPLFDYYIVLLLKYWSCLPSFPLCFSCFLPDHYNTVLNFYSSLICCLASGMYVFLSHITSLCKVKFQNIIMIMFYSLWKILSGLPLPIVGAVNFPFKCQIIDILRCAVHLVSVITAAQICHCGAKATIDNI